MSFLKSICISLLFPVVPLVKRINLPLFLSFILFDLKEFNQVNSELHSIGKLKFFFDNLLFLSIKSFLIFNFFINSLSLFSGVLQSMGKNFNPYKPLAANKTIFSMEFGI